MRFRKLQKSPVRKGIAERLRRGMSGPPIAILLGDNIERVPLGRMVRIHVQVVTTLDADAAQTVLLELLHPAVTSWRPVVISRPARWRSAMQSKP
jgi:hypothetical protein